MYRRLSNNPPLRQTVITLRVTTTSLRVSLLTSIKEPLKEPLKTGPEMVEKFHARHYISEAVRHVQMRQGTIGIKAPGSCGGVRERERERESERQKDRKRERERVFRTHRLWLFVDV